MTAVVSGPTHLRKEGLAAKLANLDWALLVSTLTLGLVGLAAVFSATQAAPAGSGFVVKQAGFLIIGVIVMTVVALVDYREWRNYLGLIVLITAVVLILVLTPLGAEVKGTKGWFRIGGISIQPAEFTKITIVLGLAAFFTGRRADTGAPRIAGALGFLALFVGLVLIEGETGSVFVYCFIALGMFLVAGVPIRVLMLLIASGAIVFGLAFTSGVLQPYQRDRLTAFVDLDADPRGAGYNQRQSVTAIGSGGVRGQGFMEGPQTQLGYLPEQQTDFIFASIGEENGFIGSAIVLGLIAVILARILRNAQLARDGFGALICAGVFSYLLIQTFQNVGMTVRLMPITGVPLPLVSYGGSSILTCMIALGLVQSVAIHRHRGTPI